MDLDLQGKRVLVTGGTRGIGAAIVDCFLDEGAQVAFCAREEDGVEAKLEALAKVGRGAKGTAFDVRDSESYMNWISDSHESMGGIDIFVPNVSGGAGQGLEAWQNSFDIDLMATVRGCEAALEYMVKGRGGAIVIIASISGLEAMGGPAPYNTVKAGLIAYASQLGEVAARMNVRVNSVSPGPIHVDDGFWGNVQRSQPEGYQAARGRQPFGRLGTPEEVAKAVVFLASPAASWITRTNLIVDGGFCQRIQF